ncbi:MAG: transposase [Treponema sp.]|jgi:REP element-mobilizing transposase RayT|nr:transposase [Treponema sp.]
MRHLRILKQAVWYEIRTRINNREPLFRNGKALALFTSVFRETERRFVLSVRGLRLTDDRLTFYVKPEDGLELPEIMKWMKQVFAQRFNVAAGRTGHIWGDRYWSRIVEGEPEEGSGGGGKEAPGGDRPRWSGTAYGDRPWRGKAGKKSRFSLKTPLPAVPSPG